MIIPALIGDPHFVQNLRVPLLALVLGLLVTPPEEPYDNFHPAWSPSGDWIAFESNRDGDFEIFFVRPDGTELTQVTRNEAKDSHPTWAPDGRWLAFESDRDGEIAIYARRFPGPRAERVTRTPGVMPSFSTEGRDVTFSAAGSTKPGIYIVGVDGVLPPRRLTDRDDMAAAWSFDGETIAFQSRRDGHIEIYTMRPDGSGVKRLTHGSDDEESLLPSWHPVSERLVFRRGGDYYAMDAKTGATERLTHDSPGNGIASWSPDGERFTIFSDRDGTTEIYTLGKDGTDPKRLTFR